MKKTRVRLDQSALYRIRSFKRLSLILRCTGAELEALAASNGNYMEYDKGGRWIEAPKPRLKSVHRRFSQLLAQIETPDYLHSAVRRRSYVTNAEGHTSQGSTIKLDLKKFYMSSRSAELYAFLTERLEWAGDVAGLMTRILTINGHLPTGGNASPLLSFWMYRPLFDAVNEFATSQGLLFSLYVDDMTLSGTFDRRPALRHVRRLVGQSRLQVHKLKAFPPGMPRVVTGVAQTSKGPQLPYSRLTKIFEAEQLLRSAQTQDEKYDALKPLVGRLCEASQIDPITWERRRDRALQLKSQIERERLDGASVEGDVTDTAIALAS